MHIARFAALVCTITIASAPLSAQLSIVNNRPGTFQNIGPIPDGGDGTGVPLNLSSANPIALRTVNTISNALFNIGPGDQIVIHNNGGVSFRNPNPADHNLADENEGIPSSSAFNGRPAFLPFWDDIDTVGDVFYREIPDDRVIIQWNRKGFAGEPPTEETTFQVQIFDHNGFRGLGEYAQYLFSDVEGTRAGSGASATIGFQNGDGVFNDVVWSLNMPAVFDGDVLSLVPEPGSALLLVVAAAVLLRRRAA